MAATFTTQQDQQGRSAAFVEAATGVLLLDPGGLDVDGLKTSIGLCGTLRGIVSAAEAGFVGELERRAGRHEATEALRKKQKVSPAKAKRRSKTSKTTSEQPELAAALADGQISEEHADAIADADQTHPDAGATQALLDQAKSQSVEQFRHTSIPSPAPTEPTPRTQPRHRRARQIEHHSRYQRSSQPWAVRD